MIITLRQPSELQRGGVRLALWAASVVVSFDCPVLPGGDDDCHADDDTDILTLVVMLMLMLRMMVMMLTMVVIILILVLVIGRKAIMTNEYRPSRYVSRVAIDRATVLSLEPTIDISHMWDEELNLENRITGESG